MSLPQSSSHKSLSSTENVDLSNADVDLQNEIPLSDAELEILREDLAKTLDEISTLKGVLASRQEHAMHLRKKLGLVTTSEVLRDEATKKARVVMDTPVFQRTVAVANAGVDLLATQLNTFRDTGLLSSISGLANKAASTARSGYNSLAGYNLNSPSPPPPADSSSA